MLLSQAPACRQLAWSPAVCAHKPRCLSETWRVSRRAGRGTQGGRPRHREKPAPQHRWASVPRHPGSGLPPPCSQRSDLTDVCALRIQGTGPKTLAAQQDVLTQSHCAGRPGRQLPLESAEDSPGRQSSSLEPEPEALARLLGHPMFLLRPPLQRGSLDKT